MIDILEKMPDRLVLQLDPGGPLELTGLTASFAALARMYERHCRAVEEHPAPRLYVTRLESGSIIAEIAPYMGALITTISGANSIGGFVRRLSAGIKAFSDPSSVRTEAGDPLPSNDDAADIRDFVRPLTGKMGARLGIKHARLEKHDSERHTIVEFSFDESALNRAAVNIDEELSRGGDVLEPQFDDESRSEALLTRVMLFFEQSSRRPGRQRGRTADRGVVPDVSSKPLPVYFHKSFQNLKDQMVQGQANPDNAFIVDVYVHRDAAGEPKAYYITHLHRIAP